MNILKTKRKKIFLQHAMAVMLCALSQASFADGIFDYLPGQNNFSQQPKTFSDQEFARDTGDQELLTIATGIALQNFTTAENTIEELVKWSADPKHFVQSQNPVELAVKATGRVLEIHVEGQNVTFLPEKLSINSLSENIEVKIISDDPSVGIFVRDKSVIAWDHKKIRALADGKTELLVTNASFFGVLEINVSSQKPISLPRTKIDTPASKLQDLTIPEGLSTIDDVVSQSTAKNNLAQINSNGESKDKSLKLKDLSIPSELTEVGNELARKVSLSKKIEKSKLMDLTLRFVDERSQLSRRQFFAAANLRVQIQGTEYIASTNELGYVTVKDVPRNAHFFVAYADPAGIYQTGVAEISTSNLVSAEQSVFVRRTQNLDQIWQTLGIEKEASQASFCGQVLDSQDTQLPLKNIAVTMDAKHLGPYYVNYYGFFSKETYTTGEDGQFCFYKIDAGPVNLNFFRGQDYLTSAIVHVGSARHTEEKFFLNDRSLLRSNLVMTSSANDQLNSNFLISSKRTLIDSARVLSLGSSEDFSRIDEGLMESPRETLRFKDATYTFVQSGEFEEMIFKQDPKGLPTEQVTVVYPRGFIEDMSVYAQNFQEQNLGSVVLEHGLLDGQGDQPVKTYLINDSGKKFGEGWMYADGAISKGLFFNVPFGHYTIMVYTQDGRWLASDTVPVYSGTASYIRTGSKEIISDRAELQTQE